MALMFFYQAALWWNMCETHATFKGVTAGLINGRTSVYHPIAWGMPLISIGLITLLEGDVMGTHPNCFISWEKDPIKMFFAYNGMCFMFTLLFTVIVIFNIMRVQSHNKDTVMYLKDQVKGMIATSVLMAILWCYGAVGYFAYMKTKDMDVVNLMPLFQICNGWFGVVMFLLLGMWSRRFRKGLSSQAEERKRKRLESMMKYGGDDNASDTMDIIPSTAQTSPSSSRPSSAFGSRPASAAASRPTSPTKSRPASATESRPVSAVISRPASGVSKAASRPSSSISKAGSRPSSSISVRESRPASAAPEDVIKEETEQDDME